MIKGIISFVIVLLVFIYPVMAVTVERSVQGTTVVGQALTVKIYVKNDLSRTLDTTIIEKTVPEFEYLDKELIKKVELEGLEYLYLEWSLKIPPNSQNEITYYISPKRPGTYYLPKTEVITSDAVYYSGLSKIHVECNGDGFCNTSIENFMNCPQDCPTGIKDGICDAIKDNRVDPDCKEGVDPDDPAIYEEKIAEKHAQANYPIYGAIAAFAGIITLIFVIILRKFRKG